MRLAVVEIDKASAGDEAQRPVRALEARRCRFKVVDHEILDSSQLGGTRSEADAAKPEGAHESARSFELHGGECLREWTSRIERQ